MLKNFEIQGENDVKKLSYIKDNINAFLDTLKGCFGDNKDVAMILEEIGKIFDNIDKNDLPNDNSPTKIKKVLASSILFSGDNKGDSADNIEEGKNLIFSFHGMRGNSEEFYNSIKGTFKDFSVVSVEYNGSSLSKLDTFIGELYENYGEAIKKSPKIYILGYSFGCLIANKFRSKLLEKFQGEESEDKDKKVHFIFYKGFYDISRCPVYDGAINILKAFNKIYEKVYGPGKGFAFLKDAASDSELADVTSNYKLLSESRQDTLFSIKYVHTNHNYFGANNSEIQDALQKIEENILGNSNMNHVLFVSSDNDEMVSDGGSMLFNDLTRPQGSAVEKRSEQSPDCCC